jgi:PAS domain-containing protein
MPWRDEYLAAVHDIQRGLGEQVELSALVSAILWHATQYFANVAAAVYLFDGEHLIALADSGHLAQRLGPRLPPDDPSLLGDAWRSDPPWSEAHAGAPGPGQPYAHVAAVPIATEDQRLGVMIMAMPLATSSAATGAEPRQFSENDLLAIRQFAGLVAISVANARMYFASRQELVERRRAEDALRESEERFRTLFEYAPEAVVVVDADTGRFVDPNGNAATLYGLSRQELLKVGPGTMSPPVQPDGRASDRPPARRSAPPSTAPPRCSSGCTATPPARTSPARSAWSACPPPATTTCAPASPTSPSACATRPRWPRPRRPPRPPTGPRAPSWPT